MRVGMGLAALVVAGVAWGKPPADGFGTLTVPPAMLGTHRYGYYRGEDKVGELVYEVAVRGKSWTTTATLSSNTGTRRIGTCQFLPGFVVQSCEFEHWVDAVRAARLKRKGASWELTSTADDGTREVVSVDTDGEPLRGVMFDLALVAAAAQAGLTPTYVRILRPGTAVAEPFGETVSVPLDGGGVRMENAEASYIVSAFGGVTRILPGEGDDQWTLQACPWTCPDRLGEAADDTESGLRDAVRLAMAIGSGVVGPEAILPFVDPGQVYAMVFGDVPADAPRPSNNAVLAMLGMALPKRTAKATPKELAMLTTAAAIVDVTVEGDTASMSIPGEGELLRLVRIDGHWTFDLASMMQMGAAE